MTRTPIDISAKLDRLLGRHRTPSSQRMQSAIERVGRQIGPAQLPAVTGVAASRRQLLSLVPVASAFLGLSQVEGRRKTYLAAAAVLVLAAGIGTAIVWRPSDPEMYRLVEGDVDQGETIRANGAGGAVLALSDGSRVEMRTQTVIAIERAEDGARIRLDRGGIIVNAAKQRGGHLYVQTMDVTVSVVGTVFLVDAGDAGSRVAVIEGEVRVHQGGIEQTLRRGEEVATNRSASAPPLREAIAWSRNATALAALLQEAAIARPIAPQVPAAEQSTTFEEISIRPSLQVGGGGRGTGTGIRRRNPRPADEPCGSDREPVVDPRRFDASDSTVHALITWAYGLNCSLWRGSDYLSGGPAWVMTDGYEIQAAIPLGAPSYTAAELRANRAPELQRMLQNLLADRFRLLLRRERRDMPVYVLSVARGGARLLPDTRPPEPEPAAAAGIAAPLPIGLSVWRDGDAICCDAITPEVLRGRKKSMTELAGFLTFYTGRPVLDRTGLAGDYNYFSTFEPQQAPNTPPAGPRPAALPPPNPRSLPVALEEDLGLRLEPATEPLEVFVIERVERPSPN